MVIKISSETEVKETEHPEPVIGSVRVRDFLDHEESWIDVTGFDREWYSTNLVFHGIQVVIHRSYVMQIEGDLCLT